MNDSFETQKQITLMKLAFQEADDALQKQEVPIGCVLVKNGEVVSSGSNRTNAKANATRHAEMEAIDKLLMKWQLEGLDPLQVAERFRDCELYVTCEPCVMCAAALSILGIARVYYGCGNDRFGGSGSVISIHENGAAPCGELFPDNYKPHTFQSFGGIMADEAVALLRGFYEHGNPNAPKPHRPVQERVSGGVLS